MAREELVERFLALHRRGEPLLLPNPWDLGSAKLLASLGYVALATTSSGFAGTLGRLDGNVSREEAIEHADAVARATGLPVNADLENGFSDTAAGVAETLHHAASTQIAGCSIEDYSQDPSDPIYPFELAVERVAAAAAVARAPASRIALTARAENHVRGRPDLADTIRRLQAFEQAGADVLYPTGLSDLGEIEQVVRAVAAPVNVLLRPGGPSVAALAAAGVARISVGGTFHLLTLATLESAGRALLERGESDFWKLEAQGRAVRERAFRERP